MGSGPLPPVVVVHVDDLELRSVLDALLTGCPSQRKVHLRRSHVVVVCCRLDYLGEGEKIGKVEMDGWLRFKDQLCHLGFAGRWRVGTVIRVPVDPTVHPVPMLLGTKSTSRDVTPPRTKVSE